MFSIIHLNDDSFLKWSKTGIFGAYSNGHNFFSVKYVLFTPKYLKSNNQRGLKEHKNVEIAHDRMVFALYETTYFQAPRTCPDMSRHYFLSLIFEKSEFRKLLISQRGRAWPMSSVALWNDSRSVVWMIYNLSSCRVRHLEKNTVEVENLKKKRFFGLQMRILRIFGNEYCQTQKIFWSLNTSPRFICTIFWIQHV